MVTGGKTPLDDVGVARKRVGIAHWVHHRLRRSAWLEGPLLERNFLHRFGWHQHHGVNRLGKSEKQTRLVNLREHLSKTKDQSDFVRLYHSDARGEIHED